jgi:hypothetical protein
VSLFTLLKGVINLSSALSLRALHLKNVGLLHKNNALFQSRRTKNQIFSENRP